MPSSKDSRPRSRNYRKPPVEHQFKKGTSGNPEGRPPKKKEAKSGSSALGAGTDDRLAAAALDEATRLVTVREGEKVSEIPAMQALLRTLIRSGAQGDIKAARQVLELIARAETERTASALDVLRKAVRYKEIFGPIFEQCERDGIPPPDIYPHPDDLIINPNTGKVTFDGPMSKEEAGARKVAREHALKSEPRLFKLAAKLDRNPSDKALRREFDELMEIYAFVKKDAERLNRHVILRHARRTLNPEPPQPEEDDTTDEA
jgi:hypothetical protein